jgi:hypothetical protein
MIVTQSATISVAEMGPNQSADRRSTAPSLVSNWYLLGDKGQYLQVAVLGKK